MSKEEKQERLRQALRQRAKGPRPLSYGQEALWFEQQRAVASPVYHIPVALRILSPLDVPALLRAVERLEERHPQLRTRFPAAGGMPQAITESQPGADVKIVNLPDASDRELREQVNREAWETFDLATGPLLRVRLYCLGESEYLLLLVVHHIVADGWSLWLLLDELQSLCVAGARAESHPLEPPGGDYSSFVSWQREMVSTADWRRHATFWQDQLTSGFQSLEMPLDRPRPQKLTFRGAAHRFRLAPDLVGSLRKLAREMGGTPAALLMAAFQTLLFRLSEQEDFVVGLPSTGRGLTRFTGVVGYFVNPLPVRARLNGKLPFSLLVGQVHDRIQQALIHQDYPFPLMVRDLKLRRDPARPPIVETAFVYHKPQRPEMALGLQAGDIGKVFHWGTWDVEPYELERASSIYDLSLQIIEWAGIWTAEFEYSTDLFDRETVQVWAGCFVSLLEGIAADPGQALEHLPILTQEERRRLLVEWNQTRTSRPQMACIHQLFERQAAASPNEPAAVFEGATWRYGALNQEANRLAHYLHGMGIGPGDSVAIHLPRSAECLAALLAVMKVGAAYLPLEVTSPLERLLFMIANVEAKLLITGSPTAFEGQLPVVKRLNPQEKAAEIAACPAENVAGLASPELPAYVIYTSGTTGRPKGVLVTHRSATNLLCDLGQRLSLGPHDVCLAHMSVAFDASVVEMFLPLSVGASVYIVGQADLIDGFRLAVVMESGRVSLLFATPSFWGLLLSTGWQGGRGIQAISGGETLLRPLADQIMSRGVKLYNSYGPTETTILCTIQPVMPGAGNIGIGWPVQNARTYILDRQMQPAPPGVPGELLIGGDPVTAGYINRPEQTAESFIPDSFADEPGIRLYRTGDRARYRHDGTIEFLGRLDRQVKIRGHRVEPGEVEAWLDRHEAVRASVVVTWERQPGDLQLYAYVQPEDSATVSAADLRGHIRKKLPAYMMPAGFAFLDAFPLTPGGKINRRALPEPRFEGGRKAGDDLLPRTETESRLARLAAEVLDLERVGIDDSFFELGGHSLSAMRLLALIQAETGQKLDMAAFMADPTVRNAAKLLAAGRQHPADMEAPIPRESSGAVGSLYPLTPGQRALWFIDRLDPEKALFNLPAAWRIEGNLNRDALEQALESLATEHDLLRSRVADEQGRAWELLPPDAVGLERVDLSSMGLEQREQALASIMGQLARRPFDLLAETPIRATIVALGAKAHVLVLVVHHIAFDGWSGAVLMEQLGKRYEAYDQGQAIIPSGAALRFADFARWQQTLVEGNELSTEIDYWRGKLAGLPSLALPYLRRQPAPLKRQVGLVRYPLPPDLFKAMQQLGQRHNASLFTTFMAAFQVWLYRHTGQGDFGVGFPVSGRLRPEIGGLIGYLVNMLVLRAELKGFETFSELLMEVRAKLLEALGNQRAPFQQVVEAVRPRRTLGQNPLFQVLFTTEMEPPPGLQLGETTVTPLGDLERTTQFDLVMNIVRLPAGPHVEVTYDKGLFVEQGIEGMAARLITLLRDLVWRPHAAIGELNLLADQERRQLLFDWNNLRSEYPRHLAIHQLFEKQAAANRGARAIAFGEACWSYGQLNARANQWAHYLRGRSVQPGEVVGVHLEHTPELLAVVLGIFKVGAVYLPLDPGVPAARLRFMVADARARIVITDSSAQWQAGNQELIHCHSGAVSAELEAQPSSDLPLQRPPNQPAYIIYTSGSSGWPKGVLVGHRSVVNVLIDHANRFDVHPGDVMLSHLSIAFDASIAEMFMPLVSGASLYLVSREEAADGYRLVAALEYSGATLMHATPSNWRRILASGWADGSAMKGFCGGETLDPALAERLLDHGVKLLNAYGPTEASIMVTAEEVIRGNDEISIGRPVPNTKVHILDDNMAPVPPGVSGEIFIGGDGLALGYINRPGLTAERFVPDPFGVPPGGRLYRSGDLGRYRLDGRIEFLGRRDRQVKVRGYRIELDEVEKCLLQHEMVDEAIVMAREVAEEDLRLAAYLVPSEGLQPEERSLRTHLQETLPAYMVPAAFVSLESMPLTPNGKVDLEALPAPVWGQGRRARPLLAPRNRTERRLVAIWAELLKTPEISVDEDFFDAGGHSLLLIRLMERIEASFGRRLPLAPFLEQATIERMAAALSSKAANEALAPLREEGKQPPLFVVTAGYGDMLALHRVAQHMAQDRPVFGLQPASGLNETPPERSLDELLQEYVEAIRARQASGPYLLAGYCSGGLLALALGQQLTSMGETVDPILLMEAPLSYPAYQHAVFRRLRPLVKRLLPADPKIGGRALRILRALFADDGLLAHLNALAGYRAGRYPGKIVLILARLSIFRLFAGKRRWEKVALGGVETHLVPGDHDNFVRGEQTHSLAAKLDELL